MLFLLLPFSLCAQEHWFMAQTDHAEIQSVTATSELVEAQFQGKYLYPPINILDGDFSTTWCEADAGGPGIGEAVTVEFAQPVSFDEIQIVNGFASGNDYYHKNNRVAELKLTQVAGEHFQQKSYTLKDDTEGWQSVSFGLPQTAQTITLEIEKVYKGSKYDDTCLSDMRLLYKGKPIPFTNIAAIRAVQEENSRLMLQEDSENFKEHFAALYKRSEDGNSDDTLYIVNDSGYGYIIKNLMGSDGQGRMTKVSYEQPMPQKRVDAYLRSKEKEDDIYFGDCDDEDRLLAFKGDVKGYDPDNYDYFIHERFSYDRYPPSYTLANFRIIKDEQIDYVTVRTVIPIKLDGTVGLYVNGEYYRVVDPDRIMLYTFVDEWP